MYIAEIVACICECVIIADFLTRFLGLKSTDKRSVKIVGCSLLLLADNIFVPVLTKSEIIPVAVMLAIGVGYSVLFLNGEIYKKVFAVFISCITLLLINMSVLMLLGKILNADIGILISGTDAVRLMVLFLTKFLYFISTRALLRLKGDDSYNFSKSEWLTVLSIFTVTFFIGIAVLESVVNGENAEIFMLSSVAGLILLNVITYILTLKMNKENSERMRAAVLEMQVEGTTGSVREIKKMYSEIQQIRHDTKHWITGVRALLKNGKYEQAAEYLESLLTEQIGTLNEYVFTENDVMNAIINSKLTEATQKGIQVNANVGTELMEIDEYRLGTVIANLLDNAIEACAKVPEKERRIYYEMGIDGEYLKIFVKNTYDGGRITLQTTKTDKKLHGYGLKTVSSFAEKNGGILNFYEKDGCFCSDLWIKAKKK